MEKLFEPELVDKEIVSYPAISSSTPFQHREYPSNWKIPGLGEITNDKCGCVTGASICPTGLGSHPVKLHVRHCKNFNCPVCYPWAAAQAARRASDRIFGGLQAYRKIGRRLGPINHIEISVPQSNYSIFDWKTYKKKAIAYAQKIGISGGAIVPHPGRVKDELKSAILEAMKKAGMERLRYWDGIRKDILNLGSFDAYLVWGPHFHIIGYFRIPVMPDGSKYTSKEFEAETGWIYKNITVDRARKLNKKIKPETLKSSYGIITYLMTHHLVERGKDGVSYFGDISYNKMGYDVEEKYEYLKCPVCMEQMFKVFAGDIDAVLGGEVKIERGVNAVMSKYKLQVRHYYVILKQAELIDFDKPAAKIDNKGLDIPNIEQALQPDIKIDDAFIAAMEKKFLKLSSGKGYSAVT